jgi:aspartyl-tRNA(Asn)/glutamyl-tRNA(Gln) amidotransferase subunit C
MLTEEELNKLAKLCRLECTGEEKKKFVTSLSRVLSHIEKLEEVNTEGIEPCNHVLETQVNVFRSDEVKDPLSREEFLSNSPAHVGGMIKVPPVMKEE